MAHGWLTPGGGGGGASLYERPQVFNHYLIKILNRKSITSDSEVLSVEITKLALPKTLEDENEYK